MQSIVCYKTGDPSVLKLENTPDPICHPKGIIMQNKVISIEGGDIRARSMGPIGKTPYIIGYQSSGVIIEVGNEVKKFNIGDRIVAMSGKGSHATLRSVPEKAIWLIPNELTFEDAACIPVTYATAHDCLFEFGNVQDEDTILIQGISGGLGLAISSLALQRNITIIGTVSDQSKVLKLTKMGIQHVITHSHNDTIKLIMDITQNNGVDLAIDAVGGISLEQAINATKYRGTVISVGNASRSNNKIDASILLRKNLNLQGVLLAAEQSKNFDRVYNLVDKMLLQAATKKINIQIDKIFPFSEASNAHLYAESRKAIGRVLIKI
jgi:NADPH2:quinone reductase